MPRQKIKVIFDDGQVFETKVTPKVEVAVEKHFNIGLQSLQADAHAEHLYYMAYICLKFSGREARSFDEFMDVLEDVELVMLKPEEMDNSDPFTTGQSGTLSS